MSLTEKYCAAQGKSWTIHCHWGRTTGTWTLEVMSFAASMSMIPVTPFPPRLVETEKAYWDELAVNVRVAPLRAAVRCEPAALQTVQASSSPCAIVSSGCTGASMFGTM